MISIKSVYSRREQTVIGNIEAYGKFFFNRKVARAAWYACIYGIYLGVKTCFLANYILESFTERFYD